MARIRTIKPDFWTDDESVPYRDPAQYARQLVCPRCGSGWPNCCDRKPDGTLYTHAETCAQYRWATDVCDRCDHAMRVHCIAVGDA